MGAVDMIPVNRRLNPKGLDRLPAVELSGNALEVASMDKTFFPLPVSQLQYHLYCRPYLDHAQLRWIYESFVVVEGAIQFSSRGNVHAIPFSGAYSQNAGSLRITMLPADGIDGALEEIGALMGAPLPAPNGIVGARDFLRLKEVSLLVDVTGGGGIRYITCQVETGTSVRLRLIPGLLSLDCIDLYFRVDRPFGGNSHISVMICGLLAMTEEATLMLSASYDRIAEASHLSFSGALSRGPLRAREVFRRLMGYDHPTLPNVEVNNFLFQVDPTTKSYSAEIALANRWEMNGPSNAAVYLTNLHFRFHHAGEAETDVEMRALFTVGGCTLYLAAAYEGVAKGWTFRGGTSAGNPIPAGLGLSKFLQAIGTFGPLPPTIEKLVLRDVDVVFNTQTSDFSFRTTATFPIDGKPGGVGDAELLVHLDFTRKTKAEPPVHALQLGGVLKIDGREFAVGYGSQGETSLLVAAYDNPKGDTLDLGAFFGKLSTGVAGSVRPNLSVTLKHAQLAYGKTAAGNSKFLFGVELGAGVELSRLPLVGSYFDRGQTLSVVFQLLALSETFTAGEVGEINRLTAPGTTKLPESEIDVAKGRVQVKAAVRLGEVSRQLELPLETGAEKKDGPAAGGAALVSPPKTSDRIVKWVDVQKAFGPFHFQRVGIGLRGANVDFLLDASLEMAGLTITLEGLAAECALADLGKGAFKPTFHLDGLGIDFKRGALEIGGALLRTGEGQYDGALTLHYNKLGVQGFGSYRTGPDGHPSLFIYALVDYPIGGPPFFQVEGLALGFGYNRTIKLPAIDEVGEFPLVKHAMAKPAAPMTPMQVVADLGSRIPVAAGEYFLTAGVKFSSFKSVNGFVLLTALFGKHFEIDVLGKATLSSPPNAAEPLVSASLALLARFAPDEGELKVMAKLLPDAYVFSKNCHLTGGFAFYCWFGEKNRGDFALTLGGYHKEFDVPPHYPRVPRLGLNWQVDANLKITAEAYFALTPSALMAGGNLAVVWQSGHLKAWFLAGVDFLIGWQPFHYSGRVQVSIGASYTFRFFGWRTVSIELAAELKVWGPPFSGIAHVKWFVISFDVAFGDRYETLPEWIKEWTAFQTAFLPSDDAICTIVAQAGKVASHGSQPGEAKPKANTPAHLGILNPRELSIVVNSAAPVTKTAGALLASTAVSPALGIAPMNKKHDAWDCQFEIRIEREGTLVNGLFSAKPLRQAVPAALWSEESDPAKRKDRLIADAVCGYEIQAANKYSHSAPAAVSATVALRRLKPLSALSGGRPDLAKDQAGVRDKMTNSVQAPEAREQRRQALAGLLPGIEIDWTGVTVAALRGAPTLVEVKEIDLVENNPVAPGPDLGMS
ncbi:MAG: DUF6603 domain-containing protein [Blastocatellia bacterium]|nr:DUF6603 domain-containing protein [Blastocatellia bacterium]